jgi:hypothetical protein
VRSGDVGYDEARTVWNGMFDRLPAVIARCAGVDDVVAAVNFAREHGLLIAVRGGGHSAVGYGTCDDGLVIDLSPMKGIEIDPAARTVRAQAGLTWGEFDGETQEHGLAITGGRFSTTGIAGLTLGSGSGWLERRCGLTADNLLSAEVVTADGEVIRASEDENSELFWGLRGGGGNFGVVTEFEYGLHQIGPLIYGGMLVAPPDRGAEILRFMREYMSDAPDDLGAGVAFVSAPPEPFVPPEMHFAPITGVIICWSGDLEEGERVVAPIREAVQPLMDMVAPMPYVALQSMLDGGGPKGTRAYFKAGFIDELDDLAIDKLAPHGNARPGPMTQLILEPLGGAISRVDDEATALGRREVSWCSHALAMWMEPDAETADAHVAWARGLAADLESETTPGVYLNYTSDVGEDKVREAYGPERYARLVALKDRYDSSNLFRLNQNISPSG